MDARRALTTRLGVRAGALAAGVAVVVVGCGTMGAPSAAHRGETATVQTAAAATTTTKSSPQIRVISACTRAVYEPVHYVMACADYGLRVEVGAYTWWTRRTAHGSGTYVFNDCNPNCAEGTFHSQSAVFTLYRVVNTTRYGRLFTRLSVDTREGHHVYSLPTQKI